MESAPWKIFQTKEGDLVIDVDGKITVNGITSAPFPSEISHAAMCDKGIVATWVDHELRLARMALLSRTLTQDSEWGPLLDWDLYTQTKNQ